MLSDLSEVIRNSERPLTEGQIKSYMMMLLKGVAFCHQNFIMHRVCRVEKSKCCLYCAILKNLACYTMIFTVMSNWLQCTETLLSLERE